MRRASSRKVLLLKPVSPFSIWGNVCEKICQPVSTLYSYRRLLHCVSCLVGLRSQLSQTRSKFAHVRESLKISDKTDHDLTADDKSTYQCKSDDKFNPILIDSSDCDSETGLQSFLITGSSDKECKRRSPSPMKSDSKKRQTSSSKPDGQRPTSSSRPDGQRPTSSSSSKSDGKHPVSSVKKINWGNNSAASKSPRQEDTELLDKEKRLRLLEQDLDYLRPPKSSSGIDFMKLFNGPPELGDEDKPCVEDNLDVDFKANDKGALIFDPASLPKEYCEKTRETIAKVLTENL